MKRVKIANNCCTVIIARIDIAVKNDVAVESNVYEIYSVKLIFIGFSNS